MCGKVNNATSMADGDLDQQFNLDMDRIIGGKNVTEGKYPWMVQIKTYEIMNNTIYVGGTIISKKYILTGERSFINFFVAVGIDYRVGQIDWENYLEANYTSSTKLKWHVIYIQKMSLFIL